MGGKERGRGPGEGASRSSGSNVDTAWRVCREERHLPQAEVPRWLGWQVAGHHYIGQAG